MHLTPPPRGLERVVSPFFVRLRGVPESVEEAHKDVASSQTSCADLLIGCALRGIVKGHTYLGCTRGLA